MFTTGLDDTFDSMPPPNGTNRERWQEHQRRQRTIRMFMTFLMVLILMDGEEANNRNNSNRRVNGGIRGKNGRIRGSVGGQSSTFVRVTDETIMKNGEKQKLYPGVPSGFISNNDNDIPVLFIPDNSTKIDLTKGVFEELRQLDSNIYQSTRRHQRFHDLIKLNRDSTFKEGDDGTVRKGIVDVESTVESWVEKEIQKEMKRADAAVAAILNNDKHTKAGDKKDKKDKHSDSETTTTNETQDTTLTEEEEERMVFHYPRNATGNYRGKWTQIISATHNISEKHQDAVRNYDSDGGKIETPNQNRRLLETEKDLEQLRNNIPSNPSRVEHDLDALGVFLLSDDMMDSMDSKDTDDAQNSTIEKNQEHDNTQTKTDKNKKANLVVTEASGRSVLQLYVRSIPAVNEYSLIDGFVKLYDVNNVSFSSPNKNLLMRVRGVVIHSIGKLSLVANDENNRSALMIPEDTNENTREHEGVHDRNKDLNRKGKDFVDVNGRRRLLSSFRDETLENYSHYWEKDIGGSDWNRYAGSEEDEDNVAKELNQRRLLKDNKSKSKTDGKTSTNTSGIDNTDGTDTVETQNTTKSRELENDIPLSESLSVVPPPFFPYENQVSIEKLPSSLTKGSPAEIHFRHGLDCEFEIDLDIKATKWSVKEWRAMEKQLSERILSIDPSVTKVYTLEDSRVLLEETNSAETLVMNLIGSVHSSNCDFASTLNVTAIRTDWDRATVKAINYSFTMMLACLSQIVVLLRQLLHSQSQSAAIRVSMICIGWQAILDAMLCIGHILLCMMMQPVFTAFAMVAFFKLLIFCVIEMKYMVIIMQARMSSSNDFTSEDLRRKVASLHLRFYMSLLLVLVVFSTLMQNHRTLCLMLMYSFWVPQIVLNVITETKRPLHTNYIYGMSVTRLIAPLYMYTIPNNFFKEFDPEYTSDYFVCEMLFLWVGLQAGILIAQGKYGTRFMIPARFLPPKYDYSRPIPESLLPKPILKSQKNDEVPQTLDSMENNPLLGSGDETGPRIRKTKISRCSNNTGNSAKSDDSGGTTSPTVAMTKTTTTTQETHTPCERPTLDCVICYNEINIENRGEYMLAPCDHIFHKECLEQWMEVKMECPICRMELPPL